MPNQDNLFSQLLSRHADPFLTQRLGTLDLFSDLTREPSYLDKFSGTGPFGVRDPFVMNMFLEYLKGPQPMIEDPVQQLHSFLHPNVYRPQTRPEVSTAPKAKRKRLSPYSQDVEKFSPTPNLPSQIDRMPLNQILRMFMRT